jgi:hypothetical protein
MRSVQGITAVVGRTIQSLDPMKYDDASWHSGGDFPKDLPPEAGATHTGMFVAWALLSGLAGESHTVDFPDDLPRLASRTMTPGEFFLSSCDGKFTDENLDEEGNAFAAKYFDFSTGQYLADYSAALGKRAPDGPNSLYYVADTWNNFDKLKPILDRRLAEWRAA